jgi:hypothetical protein
MYYVLKRFFFKSYEYMILNKQSNRLKIVLIGRNLQFLKRLIKINVLLQKDNKF